MHANLNRTRTQQPLCERLYVPVAPEMRGDLIRLAERSRASSLAAYARAVFAAHIAATDAVPRRAGLEGAACTATNGGADDADAATPTAAA